LKTGLLILIQDHTKAFFRINKRAFMDKFPSTFCATKVHIEVTLNRGQKIHEDLKTLRNKIVSAFKDHAEYHACLSYFFTSDCTASQRKDCYLQVKGELEERQFIVQGKLKGKLLKMLISSEKAKHNDHKWTMAVLEFLGEGKLTKLGSRLPANGRPSSRQGSRHSSRAGSRRSSRIPSPDPMPVINEVKAPSPPSPVKKKKKKKLMALPSFPPAPGETDSFTMDLDALIPQGELTGPPSASSPAEPVIEPPPVSALSDQAEISPLDMTQVESFSPEESVYLEDEEDDGDISHLISDQRLDLEIVREKLKQVQSNRAAKKTKKKKSARS